MPKILPKISTTILTKNFISISKAAKFLQVSPDTLRNWERQGKLLPSRTHGGARRYSTAELLKLKKEIRPFAAHQKGLMSVSSAAKALRVSPDTIRNWDRRGLIEASRTKGRARRFTRDEIRRLQKELDIEAVTLKSYEQVKPLTKIPKPSHEVHNFEPAWLRITFSTLLLGLILVSSWVLISYIDPLKKKVDETSKLVAEVVKSIEDLQRGVLGIQSQLEPSPIILPSDLNTSFIGSTTGVVITSASTPISIDTSGQIGCASCLTTSSSYISSITNSDGTLSINLADKTATVSLRMDHTNTWLASQAFNGGVEIGTVSPVVVTSGGNVGIGWTSPINKLEVAGAQTIGSGYAGAYTAPSNGLIVEGNVGIGISAPSYHLDVAGGARFGCGDDAWGNGPNISCSDIAEVYQSDGSVEVGEIVAVSKQQNIVTKSSTPYQKGIIGVYSTSPALLIGGQTILGGSGNLTDNKISVALAGRVAVKVSDENGPIEAGDYLTSSGVPGVAMKATQAGPVIGQALEPFVVSYEVTADGSEAPHLVDIRLNMGKILAFVSVSYADPGNFLASLRMDDQGNLIIPKLKVDQLLINDEFRVGSSLTTQEGSIAYVSPDNSDTFYDLSGKIASLEDRIKNQESRIKELEARASSEEATASAILVDTPEETTSSAIASIQSTADSLQPESSSSAVVSSPSAVSDLNLVPPDILLATSSATLANVKITDTLSSDKLFTAQDGKISGDLSVFGKTTLASTTIAGDLTVDGTFSINDNSINVIGSPLYLQNSPLAYQVDFFNGLVTIDKLGNLRAQTVIVSQFKVVEGKISGSGKISLGAKSVDLENPLVKSSSRILITPTSETDLVLAVTDKEEGKKFTVSTAQTAVKDIIFDWFIINEIEDK